MRWFKFFSPVLLIAAMSPLFANQFRTEQWQTANGVRVIYYQAMEVPMLDISMAFAAGSAYDGAQFGISSLTTQLMNQGNAGLSANQIAEALAAHGAQYGADTSRDMAVYNLRTLTNPQALQQSIKTFTQIITQPDFADDALVRERKQLLMAVEQVKESPDEVANLQLFQALYQQHPYAHSPIGTKESLDKITKTQVIDFYKKYYNADNAILVLVGAIENKTAHQIADQITQNLPHGAKAPVTSKAAPLNDAKKIAIQFPSSQTIIRLGQIGIDHQNPHYFPLMVGNYILGGGSLVSRLSHEVREKRGLTYGVDSQFAPMPGAGPFIITLSTKNDQAAQAIQITEDTVRTFISEGPSEEELSAAKDYLAGSFPLSLASNRTIATLLLRMNFYHLPDNYLDTYVARINAVTSEQIKQAFKQQVNPEKLALITVGQS